LEEEEDPECCYKPVYFFLSYMEANSQVSERKLNPHFTDSKVLTFFRFVVDKDRLYIR